MERALSDPRRPAEQVRLDATRKPGPLLVFAGLKPGDRVVDFMPGNAYFTRIMSAIVGPKGPRRLRTEIEAAGFLLDAQSGVLRNPKDDHKLPVFDPSVRGRTDQVVYRFRKPG